MILVLGATGNTGGEVARQLIAAGDRPRLLVREPTKATEFEGRAEIVQGEMDDRASLVAAMQGVEKLYLVSNGSRLVELETNAIEAAGEAGVRHVVKLSVLTADRPEITFAKWHAESEKALMASGIAWTMLRPGNFMTNSLSWAATVKAQGVFYQPTGDARWAPIDPKDVAAVAVAALTGEGHEGKAYELTGPESLNAAEQAERLGRAIGREVRYVEVPPEAAREGMLASGIPADYTEALLDLLAAMKAGKFDATRDGVIEVARQKPAPFEDWARRHAALFT